MLGTLWLCLAVLTTPRSSIFNFSLILASLNLVEVSAAPHTTISTAMRVYIRGEKLRTEFVQKLDDFLQIGVYAFDPLALLPVHLNIGLGARRGALEWRDIEVLLLGLLGHAVLVLCGSIRINARQARAHGVSTQGQRVGHMLSDISRCQEDHRGG